MYSLRNTGTDYVTRVYRLRNVVPTVSVVRCARCHRRRRVRSAVRASRAHRLAERVCASRRGRVWRPRLSALGSDEADGYKLSVEHSQSVSSRSVNDVHISSRTPQRYTAVFARAAQLNGGDSRACVIQITSGVWRRRCGPGAVRPAVRGS